MGTLKIWKNINQFINLSYHLTVNRNMYPQSYLKSHFCSFLLPVNKGLIENIFNNHFNNFIRKIFFNLTQIKVAVIILISRKCLFKTEIRINSICEFNFY